MLKIFDFFFSTKKLPMKRRVQGFWAYRSVESKPCAACQHDCILQTRVSFCKPRSESLNQWAHLARLVGLHRARIISNYMYPWVLSVISAISWTYFFKNCACLRQCNLHKSPFAIGLRSDRPVGTGYYNRATCGIVAIVWEEYQKVRLVYGLKCPFFAKKCSFFSENSKIFNDFRYLVIFSKIIEKFEIF